MSKSADSGQELRDLGSTRRTWELLQLQRQLHLGLSPFEPCFLSVSTPTGSSRRQPTFQEHRKDQTWLQINRLLNPTRYSLAKTPVWGGGGDGDATAPCGKQIVMNSDPCSWKAAVCSDSADHREDVALQLPSSTLTEQV